MAYNVENGNLAFTNTAPKTQAENFTPQLARSFDQTGLDPNPPSTWSRKPLEKGLSGIET